MLTRKRKLIRTSKRVCFTVKEYLRMDRAGVFGHKRMELIEGRIYEMHAQGDPHMVHITLLMIVLTRHFGDPKKDWLVVQGTYYLSNISAPDPDFIVFNVPVGTPAQRRPMPQLVVEIANTTYARDSGVKLQMYAKAGVEDYWIVNVPEKRLEVYRRPTRLAGSTDQWSYAEALVFDRTQKVSMLKRPDVVLDVREFIAE